MSGFELLLKIFVVSHKCGIVHGSMAEFFEFYSQLLDVSPFHLFDTSLLGLGECLVFEPLVVELLVWVHATRGGDILTYCFLGHDLEP